MISTPTIEIFTDGSCQGNPGSGGWAYLLRYGSYQKEAWGSTYGETTTNNRMELTAVIMALKALNTSAIQKKIIIYTDSLYVQNGITSWIHKWSSNGWKCSKKNPIKNLDLWQELMELDQTFQPQWQWVKAHAGHPENELVDQLARSAAVKTKDQDTDF